MTAQQSPGARLHAEHVDVRKRLAELQELRNTDETVDAFLESWALGYLPSAESMALGLAVKLAAEKREAQEIALRAAETSAKTCDRQVFEDWVSSPPYEYAVCRFADDPAAEAWPGNYVNIGVQLAWDAWQESQKQMGQG